MGEGIRTGSGVSPRVLLVEDDFDEQHLVLRVIQQFDPTLVLETAHTGKEAILHLESLTRTELPKLVLLDLDLPIVSGLEVLKRLRQRTETRVVPVTVFTGSDRESDRLACEALHASFVKKPVLYDEYVTVLHAILHYWIKLNKTSYDPS